MAYPSNSDAVAQDQIRSFFQRWQRLEEEKAAISDDLKELFAEAKANGFDTKVLRSVFRDQTKDHAELAEREAIYELYSIALGTPIANARDAREEDHEPAESDPSGVAADQGGEGVAPILSAEPIQSGEAHQEGAAVGESPTPEPADESGPNAGGENVARANPAKAAGEASSDAPPAPTAADNARKIRPWCLHADNLSKCGGYGKTHCHSCLKAHADAEGLSA